MKNSCRLPDCYPVSYNEIESFKTNTESFETTTQYTCPEGWASETPDGGINGTCKLPFCQNANAFTRPQYNNFNFKWGPNNGGYPINRRSAADFCVDIGNGNDYTNQFKTNLSPTWPPRDTTTAAAIVKGDANNKSQTAAGYAKGLITAPPPPPPPPAGASPAQASLPPSPPPSPPPSTNYGSPKPKSSSTDDTSDDTTKPKIDPKILYGGLALVLVLVLVLVM